MSCMAYHQETLRKARIQERAREAQKNMQQQSASAHANQRREPLEPYQPTASYSSDPRSDSPYNVDQAIQTGGSRSSSAAFGQDLTEPTAKDLNSNVLDIYHVVSGKPNSGVCARPQGSAASRIYRVSTSTTPHDREHTFQPSNRASRTTARETPDIHAWQGGMQSGRSNSRVSSRSQKSAAGKLSRMSSRSSSKNREPPDLEDSGTTEVDGGAHLHVAGVQFPDLNMTSSRRPTPPSYANSRSSSRHSTVTARNEDMNPYPESRSSTSAKSRAYSLPEDVASPEPVHDDDEGPRRQRSIPLNVNARREMPAAAANIMRRKLTFYKRPEYMEWPEPQNQSEYTVDKFRVGEEGFRNRYRSEPEKAPHYDQIYTTMYPGSDYTDYTDDSNRTNRRQNLSSDRYSAMKKVNGDLHVKVLNEMDRIPQLQTMVFNVDYPVKHRKVDNTTVDRVAPLLCPPPRPVTTHGYHCPPSCQSADQSRRRVHYKVTHSFESNHQGHRMAQLQRGASSHPEQRQMSSDAFQGYVHKDLKMQEKTLRNHNMVMGPMEAFDDLLNPRNYKTYRPSSQHY